MTVQAMSMPASGASWRRGSAVVAWMVSGREAHSVVDRCPKGGLMLSGGSAIPKLRCDPWVQSPRLPEFFMV